jgi:hypothetical protein
VIVKKHASVGLTGGYAVMANQPINPTVTAALSPAKYYTTVAISGDEERMNSGNKEKLADMLEIQMKNAKSTLIDTQVSDLYGSSTSRGDFNTIVGLGAITGQGTYAGLAYSTYSDWGSYLDSTAYIKANLQDPMTTSYLPKLLRAGWMGYTVDGTPNLVVTTADIFNLYQDIVGIQNLQYNDNTVADLGFKSVKFQGGEMVYDKNCTAGSVFLLNTETMSFFVFSDANYEMKEPGWQIPTNQDAKVAQIIWMGQLRCDSPKENSAFTSIGLT